MLTQRRVMMDQPAQSRARVAPAQVDGAETAAAALVLTNAMRLLMCLVT